MLSYTSSLNLYYSLTDNSSSGNATFGATMINEGIRTMLSRLPWPFLEKTSTAPTVAGTQGYTLPGDLSRLISVYITVGTIQYIPTEITSASDWERLNAATGIQSDAVSNYFIIGNTVKFWPTPASSGNTVTFDYTQLTRDLNTADFSTGTITTATNGSTTIVGSGTSWTAGMAGSYIRITSSNAANAGDGLWYKIASVTNGTTLVLDAAYKGTSISGGTAAYTIGNCSLIPEKYQTGPVYYAAAEYWRKQGMDDRADRFEAKFNDILQLMISEEGTKGSSVVVDSGSDLIVPINPNLARYAS